MTVIKLKKKRYKSTHTHTRTQTHKTKEGDRQMRYINRILEDGKQMYKVTDLAEQRKPEFLFW